MAPPAQQPQHDNSLALLWILVGVFLLLGIIWFQFKVQIVHFVFQIKLYEIAGVSYFNNSLLPLKHWILTTLPSDLTVDKLIDVCSEIGNYVRYPVIGCLVILGCILLFHSSGQRYSATYTMRKLVLAGKETWPQICPTTNIDLIKEDIDKGPWAMSMTPMQFAKRNNLLKEERKALTEGMLSRSSKITVSLIKGSAHRVFALQLGRPWSGISALTPHARALFAIFAAKAQGDDAAARKLLSQISSSTETGRLNFTGAKHLISKYGNHKFIHKIIETHGYELTVLATMLELARSDGVLASADFLWLKPLDRSLWYMLNSVGRQTAVPEIAGAYNHWLAEKEMGKKLIVPMVDDAVRALDVALSEIIYVPDEVEDITTGKL